MLPAIASRSPSRRSPRGSNVHRDLRRHGAQSLAARAGRALFALCTAATILSGCPLYSDECDSRNDCASGFYCDQYSQRCAPYLDVIGCTRPGQCASGETCTADFACRPGSCDFYGCVSGYRCGVVDSAHTCVPVGADAGPVDASAPTPADASVGEADASPDGAGDASLPTPGDGGADAATETTP